MVLSAAFQIETTDSEEPKAQVGAQSASWLSQATRIKYQKVFLKTHFHLPSPLSQSIHISSEPGMEDYFRKTRGYDRSQYLSWEG